MTLRRRKFLPWQWRDKHQLEVKRAGAARAMFISHEVQRIHFQIETTDDQVIEFELTLEQAAGLLQQMIAAYRAIVPNITQGRGWN